MFKVGTWVRPKGKMKDHIPKGSYKVVNYWSGIAVMIRPGQHFSLSTYWWELTHPPESEWWEMDV